MTIRTRKSVTALGSNRVRIDVEFEGPEALCKAGREEVRAILKAEGHFPDENCSCEMDREDFLRCRYSYDHALATTKRGFVHVIRYMRGLGLGDFATLIESGKAPVLDMSDEAQRNLAESYDRTMHYLGREMRAIRR